MPFADTLLQLLHRCRFAVLWAGLAWWAGVSLRDLLRRQAEQRGFGYALDDLLVSYADGPTRRGLIGEAAIVLSNGFGGAPAVWAWGFGALATAALFALAIGLLRRLPKVPGAVVLVLSPAGLLYFTYDPGAALRKEILGLLAVALVLRGANAASRGAMRRWTGAGAVVFLAMLFAHEAIVFLWPVLTIALWLSARAHPATRGWHLGLAGLTGAGGAALVALIAGWPMPEAAALCRAAQVYRCGGPFGWLSRDSAEAVAYVFGRREAWEYPVWAALVPLAYVTLAGVRLPGRSRRAHLGLALLPLLAVAPLFALGFDWGRWIIMAVLPLTLCAATAVGQGLARFDPVLPAPLALVYLGTWALPHAVTGDLWRGVFFWPTAGIGLAVCLAIRRARRLRPVARRAG